VSRKSLPTVTSDIPRDLRNFVDRLRDLITGNGSARLVSAQELANAGVVTVDNSGAITAATTVIFGTPPAPTGVTTAAAIQNVIVEWDAPNYPGHAHAEVWGASTNDLGAAVLLGMAPGAIYTDPLGPGATRYYWVRFVNTQDTAGAFNATSGVVATTSSDVDYLLTTLSGQISTTQLVTSLNTRLNKIETNEAAITTEATTRTNADNSLYAQYTVKLDVNGYVSGFGLASTLNNATPYSNFIFKADQFAFGAPNQTSVYPFVIQATQGTVNGVTVPAGVYIDAAYIKNGTITNAKIGNAAIDNAKISSLAADKITAGELQAGSYIRSSNYVAGSQGFNIPAGGSAEFSNVTVRGAVYASSGTFAGSLSAATGTFAGSLSAAGGTFAGELSAATGTFSGSLTVGSSPAISGTSMSGTGAKIYDNGNFAFGKNSTNIVFDGSQLYLNGFQQLSSSSLTGGLVASGASGYMSLLTFTIPAAAANKPVLLLVNGSFFAGNSYVGGVWQNTGTTWFQSQGSFSVKITSNNVVVFSTGLWYVPSAAIRLNSGERTGAFPLTFTTMVSLAAGTYTLGFEVSTQCKDNAASSLGFGDTFFETVRSIAYVATV